MNTQPRVNFFKDRGHYYVNEELVDGMTMAQCRDAGGIPSVTTKIASWNDDGLIFWKIGENVEAAYNCIDAAVAASSTLEEFRVLTAEEFYRVHNELRLGQKMHDAMFKVISTAIPMVSFQKFFTAHADPEVKALVFSAKAAYAWLLDLCAQGIAEKKLYSKEHGISGTADYSGMVNTKEGESLPGGVDWKCKYIKKHPGFSTKTGEMLTFRGPKKEDNHRMQLGAYGRVEEWQHGWICYISTNPDVQGIKPIWYDKAELIKGYRAYANISSAYDILNGFK